MDYGLWIILFHTIMDRRPALQRVYGEESQTSGMTIDDIRDTLLNAGMNSNSDLVEWSTSGVDRRMLEMIMGEHTPKNSILLPRLEKGSPRIPDHVFILLPPIPLSGPALP